MNRRVKKAGDEYNWCFGSRAGCSYLYLLEEPLLLLYGLSSTLSVSLHFVPCGSTTYHAWICCRCWLLLLAVQMPLRVCARVHPNAVPIDVLGCDWGISLVYYSSGIVYFVFVVQGKLGLRVYVLFRCFSLWSHIGFSPLWVVLYLAYIRSGAAALSCHLLYKKKSHFPCASVWLLGIVDSFHHSAQSVDFVRVQPMLIWIEDTYGLYTVCTGMWDEDMAVTCRYDSPSWTRSIHPQKYGDGALLTRDPCARMAHVFMCGRLIYSWL